MREDVIIVVRNVTFAVALAALLLWLTGCSGTLNELHSKNIDQGCEMINATAKLGYFGQAGQGSACKMICSKDLPKGYKYSFDNGMCEASVGK